MRNLRCSRQRRQGQSWRAIGEVTILPSIVPDDFACSHTVELGAYMQCFAPQLRPGWYAGSPAGTCERAPLAIVHEAKVQEQQPAWLLLVRGATWVRRVCEGYSERSIGLDARRVP